MLHGQQHDVEWAAVVRAQDGEARSVLEARRPRLEHQAGQERGAHDELDADDGAEDGGAEGDGRRHPCVEDDGSPDRVACFGFAAGLLGPEVAEEGHDAELEGDAADDDHEAVGSDPFPHRRLPAAEGLRLGMVAIFARHVGAGAFVWSRRADMFVVVQLGHTGLDMDVARR